MIRANANDNETSRLNNFAFCPVDQTKPRFVPALVTSSSSLSAQSSVPSLRVPSSSSSTHASVPHKLLYPIQDSTNISRLSWVALTPLEMVEKIIMMTNGDCSGLSLSDCSTSLNAILHDNNGDHEGAGQKRKRDDISEGTLCREGDDETLAQALVEKYSSLELSDTMKLKTWDELSATGELADLNSLVKNFEQLVTAHPNRKWCIPSYSRLQESFKAKLQATGYNKVELESSIATAAIQMKALLAMASSEEDSPSDKHSSTDAALLLALAKPTSKYNAMGFKHRPELACQSNSRNAKTMQDTFQSCMMLWVKHNFANPFIDDDILEALATYMISEVRCINVNKNDAKALEGMSQDEFQKKMLKITSEKIQTWLVNNRTRRWRPTLELAFNAKRPAILLFEDSIRLFNNEKRRPIKNWDGDMFASDPKYSIPLKEWKKKVTKGEKKSIGKSASNRGTSKSSNSTIKSSQATAINSSLAARKPNEPKKTLHSKNKTNVLNDTTSPPLAALSPMCTHIDKMLVDEGIASDFAEV